MQTYQTNQRQHSTRIGRYGVALTVCFVAVHAEESVITKDANCQR